MYDSLNINFNSKHRLAICRPRGIIDGYFTTQLLNFLLAVEEVCDPFNRVLDLTLAAEIPLTTSEIQDYADARRQATAHLPQFSTAIIAPRPDAEATARIFAALMKDSKIEVDIFPNATSAAEWLHVPEELIRSQSSPPEPR